MRQIMLVRLSTNHPLTCTMVTLKLSTCVNRSEKYLRNSSHHRSNRRCQTVCLT